MSRLREGGANTARGAAHFLRETVGRVRYAGGRGQLTVRAAHYLPSCSDADQIIAPARPSISVP